MTLLLKKAIQQNKKLFAKFFISLGVCLALAIVSCCLSLSVAAQAENETAPVEAAQNTVEADPDNTDDPNDPDDPDDPDDPNNPEQGSNAVNEDGTVNANDRSALYELIGVDASEPIEIIILITLLSVAPSFMIMLTSFTRIIIVLSFMRTAMQTNTTPPNMVLTGLALFLTVFIMWPVFSEINETAYVPYANGEISTEEAIERAGEPLKTFMLKQTTNRNMKFFMDLQDLHLYTEESLNTETPVEVNVEEITLENYQDQLGFQVVIPAFIISELSRAFQMGFMLFIPFLVIDLVVSSTLMSMGMMMLPPAMISLPFKILLFVLIDGWQMIVGSLVSSFNL